MSSGIKVLLGILGGALLMLMLFVVLAGGSFFGSGPMMGQGGMMGQPGWWGPGGMMGGTWSAWGLLWMFIRLLFWGGLLAVIVWTVIRLTSGRHDEGDLGPQGESAEEILRQRFARGEIDAEEFEERRRILAKERNDYRQKSF